MSHCAIVVVGAAGRMGRRLLTLAPEHACHVVAAIENAASTSVGKRCAEIAPEATAIADLVVGASLGPALESADVMVDFALTENFGERVEAAARAGVAVVSGVTGLDAAAHKALTMASQQVPVLWAPNMSQGVAALLELVERAALALPEFEIEIHEIHHHNKADAPSGTAVALAQKASDAGGGLHKPLLCRGRNPGQRTANEIGVVATRGGDTVGEHTVYFFGAGERIELSHRALNRDIFAHGALRAAQWIRSQPPGLYRMQDVIATAALQPGTT